MTVYLDPTPENKALAGAVQSRINADSRIVNAKAALWRLVGAGAFCTLLGTGAGAAFYGYSYLYNRQKYWPAPMRWSALIVSA